MSFKAVSHFRFVISSYHCIFYRLHSAHEFQVDHRVSFERSFVGFVGSRNYCSLSLSTCSALFARRGSVVSSHPSPPFLRWRFWPEQLLPSSAFLPTRGRLRARLTAARRLAAVARATDPQADGPGFFESTSTSCVPLYATEPADVQADELACHARRIRESAEREKLNCSFSREPRV